MRNLLFFWCLTGTLFTVNSQNINVAHHSYVDNVANLLSIGSKHFYCEQIVSSHANNPYKDSSNLVGVNNSGKVLFKVNFNMNESNYVNKTIRTLDDCILVLGRANGCDYDVNPKNFIFKIDTAGIVKFQTLVNVNGFSDWFYDVVQHTDSSYYLIADSSISHVSKTGQFLSKNTIGLAYPNAMTINYSGEILVNGVDANFVTKNTLINVAGSTLNEQIANDYRKIYANALTGNYYGLSSSNTIEKINSSLLSTNSTSSTLNPDIGITSFVLRNDSIFFTGILYSTKTPVYKILNQNLTLLYITQSSYKNVFPKSISVNNQNKVCIVANATSSVTSISIAQTAFFMSLYQFPVTGDFLSTPDIGVQSFSLINTSFLSGQNFYLLNLNVTVKNYSNDTIKNFYLNSRAEQVTCGFYQFHKLFTTTILPNSSIVVQTSNFVPSIYLAAPANSIPGSSFPFNLCLFTTVPNQQSDKQINNDTYCEAIQIIVTGIENIELNDLEFKIYPNPFNDHLTIMGEVMVEKLIFIDALGSTVKEITVNQSSLIIDNSDLAPGIYVVKVETEKGTVIKKIIKK